MCIYLCIYTHMCIYIYMYVYVHLYVYAWVTVHILISHSQLPSRNSNGEVTPVVCSTAATILAYQLLKVFKKFPHGEV